MQPLLIKVDVPQEASFSVNRYVYHEHFPGIWQFHDEYELTLILRSCGTRIVGDSIERFEKGDLVFIGKNLPHTWKNDVHFCSHAEALVLHFRENFLGAAFFDVQEMSRIKLLLERSKRGLKIIGNTNIKVEKLLLKIEQSEGAEKFIFLFTLLHLLSGSKEMTELSSVGFINSINKSDSERLNKVYEYIMNNFQSDISLIQAAAIANMSPTAFSRYFKNRTRKSFSEFLIQLRIGYACKLLLQEEQTVSQACFESGFQNLSNFNEQFKKINKLSPKKYQLLHVG